MNTTPAQVRILVFPVMRGVTGVLGARVVNVHRVMLAII
jgi:hypothetical protein